MKRAFSYVRFSSQKQEQGDSLRRQTKLAREYCEKNGLILDDRSFTDRKMSAFKGKNKVKGALGTMIAAIDDGRIPAGSYLLVESLDRVSREEVFDALQTFLSLINRDIVLVTLLDGYVFTRENINKNWFQLIAALGIMARANEESATKSVRVKARWEDKRAKGQILTAMGPGWLQLSPDRTTWELIPDKVALVQRVFHMAGVDMLGTPTIARILQAEGVPTLREIKPQKQWLDPNVPEYYVWEPGIVMALLKNRSVIGTYTPKKAEEADPLERYYPEIIKPELFARVQELIQSRQRTGGPRGEAVSNIFSGLFRCECGSRVRYVSSNKPHVYLQCLKSYTRAGCDAPTMPYTVIEDRLLSWLLTDEDLPLGIGDDTLIDPSVLLKVELADTKSRRDRLLDLAEQGTGTTTSAGLFERLQTLEEKIADLQKQIKQAIPKSSVHGQRVEAIKLYEQHTELKNSGNTDELRKVREALQNSIRGIVGKVVLLKDTEVKKWPTKKKPNQVFERRRLVVYGPLVEKVIANQEPMKLPNGEQIVMADWRDRLTPDGGLMVIYVLPEWGINGTRRRKA